MAQTTRKLTLYQNKGSVFFYPLVKQCYELTYLLT